MSTETLYMRATIAEIKNAFDRFIGILIKAERRLSKLMDMLVRISRREEQEKNFRRKKKLSKNM